MACPKFLSAWVVALACTAMPAHADDAYAAGQEAAAEYRYAESLTRFREAAGQGHRQAQLIAGGMLLHCERLYSTAVPCDRVESAKWLRLAAAQGSEVSRYLLRHADLRRIAATEP